MSIAEDAIPPALIHSGYLFRQRYHRQRMRGTAFEKGSARTLCSQGDGPDVYE